MTKPGLVRFESMFLMNVWKVFSKRGKSLKHGGEYWVSSSDATDEVEWIRFVNESANRLVLVVELDEDAYVDVYVRSNASADRGKILFRLECLRLSADPNKILAAFEASRDLVSYIRRSESLDTLLLLEGKWKELTLRILDFE